MIVIFDTKNLKNIVI